MRGRIDKKNLKILGPPVSRARARASGSSVILLPRHLAEAALALRWPDASTHSSPSAVLPAYFDELCAELAAIHDHDAVTLDARRGRGDSSTSTSTRVLVVSEANGVVSSMLILAGAHVATCDLRPSEIDYTPHFRGDALHISHLHIHIQNLGWRMGRWDLVVAHPPCTYLFVGGELPVARSGNGTSPGSHKSAARVFLAMASANADAPFVAVGNPRMHAEASALVRGLRLRQFVCRRAQHGTGHKP